VLPEVPTLAEAGLPGFRSITWFRPGGAAADAPRLWADRINRDVVAILKTDAAGAKLRDLSLDLGATRARTPRNSSPRKPRSGPG